MSTMEILAELPRLSAQERAEILTKLWQLEEFAGPTAHEKALLNKADAHFDVNPAAGAPWREVEARIRRHR